MNEAVVISLMLTFAAMAAFVCALAAIGSLQVAKKFNDGMLHYFFYALFFSAMVTVIGWNRQYTNSTMTGAAEDAVAGGFGGWAVRLSSSIAVVACIDQLLRYGRANPKINGAQMLLLVSFLFFWLTNTIIPANFSTHTSPLGVPWLYTLMLTPALLTLSAKGVDKVQQACRNAILMFCAVSLMFILVRPSAVLDNSYVQGYIPGMPRFTGLASHPVGMGMCAGLGMWCLISEPLTRKWLNRLAWACCLTAMLLSQAKAAIITFLPGVPVLLYYQFQAAGLKNTKAADFRVYYGLFLGGVAAVLLGLFYYIIFSKNLNFLSGFMGTRDGAQLLSLTGRDKIWAIAIQEWRSAPIFGYGLSIFGPDFQHMINMPNATSGHSQIYDSLGRVGSVGALGCVIYLAVLLGMGFKYAKASLGLSLVLAASLVVRGLSEVSVGVRGLDIIDITQYLLIAVLAGSIIKTRSPGT
jgi:O-antigen ligase